MGLVMLLNIAGIVGYAITTESIWDFVSWVQETYSPFNLWTHGINVILVFSAILTYFWRKKKNTKGVE